MVLQDTRIIYVLSDTDGGGNGLQRIGTYTQVFTWSRLAGREPGNPRPGLYTLTFKTQGQGIGKQLSLEIWVEP